MLLQTSCYFTTAMSLLKIFLEGEIHFITALNPHGYVVYFVIKGEIVTPNPKLQYRPTFSSGQENSFKGVLSVTSNISTSPLFLSCLAVLCTNVCFNLHPCNLLSISPSLLPTSGSLRLMKNFLLFTLTQIQRLIKVGICFLGITFAHRNMI